jgi:hypothetical protein
MQYFKRIYSTQIISSTSSVNVRDMNDFFSVALHGDEARSPPAKHRVCTKHETWIHGPWFCQEDIWSSRHQRPRLARSCFGHEWHALVYIIVYSATYTRLNVRQNLLFGRDLSSNKQILFDWLFPKEYTTRLSKEQTRNSLIFASVTDIRISSRSIEQIFGH